MTILLKIIGSAHPEDAMEVDTNADAVKTILNESSLWCELSTFQLTLFSTFDWYKENFPEPLFDISYFIDVLYWY